MLIVIIVSIIFTMIIMIIMIIMIFMIIVVTVVIWNCIRKQNITYLRHWLRRGTSETRGLQQLHHLSRRPSPAASAAETAMPECGY